jgi:hypothetical protein
LPHGRSRPFRLTTGAILNGYGKGTVKPGGA